MDEIELIREFRDDLPGARPHSRDAARAVGALAAVGAGAFAPSGPADARADPDPESRVYKLRNGRMEQVQPGG